MKIMLMLLDHQNILSANLSWIFFHLVKQNINMNQKYKSFSIKIKLWIWKNKANVDLQLAIKAYDIAKQN